jgi:hypothetical protein
MNKQPARRGNRPDKQVVVATGKTRKKKNSVSDLANSVAKVRYDLGRWLAVVAEAKCSSYCLKPPKGAI